jgi:DNA-binding HxlR family transcriptional regulator
MSRKQRHEKYIDCPVEAALDIIGGKWKPVILLNLEEATRRFNELRRLMPNITQRMLTHQLRELEADGIVHRKIYPQVPPKVEYSLTELGRTLTPVLFALREWGAAHALPNAPDATLPQAPATTPPDRSATPGDTRQPQHRAASQPNREVADEPTPPSRVGRPWGTTGTADAT